MKIIRADQARSAAILFHGALMDEIYTKIRLAAEEGNLRLVLPRDFIYAENVVIEALSARGFNTFVSSHFEISW